MVNYYLIMFLLAFVCLVFIIYTYEIKTTNFYILLATFLGTLSNAGYLLIAISKTVSEAVLANKIVYLGGCFIPAFVIFLIFTICNYKLSRLIKSVILSAGLIVYIMVLTTGYNDFYYKDIYLYDFLDAKVLGHSYGPGHTFFYVLLCGFIGLQISLLLYTFIKKKVVSRSNLNLLIIVTIANISSFIVARAINPAIEVMPVVYVIDSFVFLYMCKKWNRYNLIDNIIKINESNEEYGYAFVDQDMNFLSCNNAFIKVFPSFANCKVDENLEQLPGTEQVLEWFLYCKAHGKYQVDYEYNEKHYEGYVEPIMDQKKNTCSGYVLELRDDTDRWKYLKLIAEHNATLANFSKELELKVYEQTDEILRQKRTIDELYMKTVIALSDAIDAKDRYTSGHSKRVAQYAKMIAIRLGKTEEEQDEIYRAGLLHDVGKIRVPAEIINKQGKLTDEEYNIIKIHPITGYHILRGISEQEDIAIASKYHHERYDGKGYPNGLEGENIPEIARILGVADAYDAMASNRSYRNALPQDVVKSEIIKGRGTQFDPRIADIMIKMIEEDTDYMLKQRDSEKMKILTVDDEAINNKIIAHIMKDEPMYEIIPAKSGLEALDILANNKINLVLLDVNMPEMDGFETLKRIREHYSIPVVFMTSDRTLEISASIIRNECDDYLTKPFLPLMVKELVYNMTRDMHK